MKNSVNILIGITLIIIFQLFFYVKDFQFLHLFSKIVPTILGLLIFIFSIKYYSSIKAAKYLILYFIVIVLLSIIFSYLRFGQPLMFGLAAQLKIFTVFYFFLIFHLLNKMNIEPVRIQNIFIGLGMISIFIYFYINLTLDPKSVWTKESSIVVSDTKGFRFRFKSVFICILLFQSVYHLLNKSGNKIRYFIFAIVGLLYFVVFAKQRVELIAILLVLTFMLLKSKSRALRLLTFSSASVVVFLIIGSLDEIFLSLFPNKTNLGVRGNSIADVVDFISNNDFSVIFGSGSLYSGWNQGFSAAFGDNFFVSDIGWVGVLFESGLIGVFLVLGLYYVTYKSINSAIKVCDLPLLHAFKYYVICRFIMSIVVPTLPFYTGMFAAIIGISIYLTTKRLKV